MELSDKELLNFAIENGIIDVSDIQHKIEMNERNRYIENHNYSIWQSKDGKFYTYLPDEKYNRGKRLIKRTTEQALNDAIVQFYKEQENEPYIEDVFDEWLGDKGVKEFCEWSYKNGYDENAPRGQCTLDRIDYNGDYCPENCRWVSMYVQANNKRNNNYYTIDGVTKTLSEWCGEYGNLCVQSVYHRLQRGWDIKTALEKPMQKKVSEMTDEELAERKRKALERDRKWRSEHKEQVQASRRKWIENNPEKNIQSKRRYEEKKKIKKM